MQEDPVALSFQMRHLFLSALNSVAPLGFVTLSGRGARVACRMLLQATRFILTSFFLITNQPTRLIICLNTSSMYWPSPATRRLDLGGQRDCLSLVANRRGTLFVTLNVDSLIVWHAQPLCQLAAVRRKSGSLSKYGDNKSVRWSPDGHALVVLVSSKPCDVSRFADQLRRRPPPTC